MSRNNFSLTLLMVLACALLTLPALADSQARIVRLSDVQGSVEIDKNTGAGFENAFLNLPVTQGTQLRTRDTGRAEIEFEDGSTMRLTPHTTVQFSTLANDDSGKHLSVVNLVDGMAYVNWLGKDELTLNFSREKVLLMHATHLRVDTSANKSEFAVFKGDVEVEGPSGRVAVGKKKMATFEANADQPSLAKLQESPLDSWDKEAIEYHQQYAKNNSSPYGYGASDLSYYGNYSNIPGYGMMWQPYFTGVGWDPFMDGAWSFYPGYGYMFVSAYPWGWLPYRYGNWMFVPGFGWMWQPGYWNTWNTVPRYSGNPPVRFTTPARPTGTTTTVFVGRGGPLRTGQMPSRLVVSSGTAGMGIGRGSIRNLGHLNTEVAKSGSVSVRPAPQFSSVRGSGSSSSNAGYSGSRPSSSGGSMGSQRSAGPPPAPPSRGSSAPARTGGTAPHR